MDDFIGGFTILIFLAVLIVSIIMIVKFFQIASDLRDVKDILQKKIGEVISPYVATKEPLMTDGEKIDPHASKELMIDNNDYKLWKEDATGVIFKLYKESGQGSFTSKDYSLEYIFSSLEAAQEACGVYLAGNKIPQKQMIRTITFKMP